MHPRLFSLAALLLLCLAACTSPPSQPTGSVQFAASTQQALSASDITRVKVTVSAADMPSLVVELAKSNGSWGGLIGNIPAGSNRSFLAEAFDSSNTQRFQGQASDITIIANQTTAVAITLQEIAPPPPYANEAPVIDSVVSSSTSVQTGASLSLTATVHDPNAGDTLTLAWTASGGSFSNPTAATASWTAPSSVGVQTLTFTVTDSQGAAASVSLVVNVVSGTSTGNAAVNISFNLFPVVSRVSASLNRLDAGQSTSVSANASDVDGDVLTYQWTATCPGTWTNATSSSASFVPSSVPAGTCNNCQLTVTVQDGRGGQNTGSLNLCIAAASTNRFAPLVTNYYQSALSTSPGQTVTFDVTALDSQASSLTFTWAATTGSLATAQSTATTSRVVWTAPACAQTGITPTITATVTNAYGLSASKPFSLSGLPTCVASWAPAGFFTFGRGSHTATLLPSGKVLIAGGYDGANYFRAADVYDPGAGTWKPTGGLVLGRGGHTATLLNNGKILVAGGTGGNGQTATAELYDPDTGTWSTTGAMTSARSRHTATLLPNGKVLVAGGLNRGGYLATAEVYDPDTGTWSATAPMASGRTTHTATLLSNGKVLVAGGTKVGGPQATAEVYDPDTGTWSATAPMASARQTHTATLLPNGKVLVAGGYAGSYLAAAEVYDPASGTWSATAPMAWPRANYAATLLSHGKVLVSGGYISSSSTATAEVYDPDSGTWSTTGSMATARVNHTATLLSNGKVLVAAGATGSVTYARTGEMYTP